MLRTLILPALLAGALAATTPRAAEPVRPLLQRKVLGEKLLADYAQGAGPAKALHEKAAVEAREGKLAVRLPGREKDPGALLWEGDGALLAGMDVLRADVDLSGESRIAARFELDDGGKPAVFALNLDPGANAVALPLWNLYRDGSEERIDAAKLKRVRLVMPRRADAVEFSLARLAAQKLFERAAAYRCFDFGEGERFEAAAPVGPGTLYDAARGYGLRGENLRGRQFQESFALLGDQLEGEKLGFRLDLPDGAYEVQAVAFGTNWQGVRSVSYKLLAGGKTVVDRQITPELFFSYDLQYYGANLDFDPARTLFDQYHRKYFEAHRFEAQAAGGALELGFEHAGVRALWVYPLADAEEGRAFVECLYGEADYRLWNRVARVREHAPNPAAAPAAEPERARGYRLFARNYQYRVYPNHEPSAQELIDPAAGLELACAPNEFEPLTFALRPLRDLGATKIEIGELSSGAHKLPGSAFALGTVMYFPQQVQGIEYEPVPSLVRPYRDLVLKQGWNVQYWATLFVPPGTPSGVYKGVVSIASEHGQALELPLAVRVRAFELPRTTTECGMWNNGAFSNHMLSAFPEHEPYVQQTFEAEVKNWADHGMNGYALDKPEATYNREQVKVTLDFKHLNRQVEALKKYGMTGRHMLGGVANMIQYGLMRKGFVEFSPEFNKALLQILAEIRDWMEAKDVRAVVQVFDEPRETELNPWNRNRRDTLKYLKLCRQVEGLPTMTTLMGDKDGFGRPYTPLVPLLDVVSTHPWEKSDDSIYLCIVEGLADLWLYNGGASRLTHGFYLWKSKALGHWQWVYSWEVRDGLLPVVHPKMTSLAYACPGGYLNTLDFEAVREGIDDHRYLELLEAELKKAGEAVPAAKQARAFFKAIEDFLPSYPKDHGLSTGAEAGGVYNEAESKTYFDPWREQVAEYIDALRGGREARKLDAAWAMFPRQLTAEQRRVVCRLVKAPPKLDGKDDDEAWRDAPETSGFLNLARGVRVAVQTHVKTVCDGKRLYFFFRCGEPKYGELKAYAIERDRDVWKDDSVEVFLDANRDKRTYKHLIVNCLGTVQDGDGRDPLWNAEFEVQVSKGKGFWTVECAVTLDSLGAEPPKPGALWGVNLCRNRMPEPAETSSWAWVGHSFHNPEGFGELSFEE
ncbi:MAG: carbohydrate-binding family 9-like protein [Planctomycetota bacterium]|nr:carbohydrate-binding family 9-like protein [Planctomycetota bacterium]